MAGSYMDYHVPHDLNTVEDVREWARTINASPEAIAVWAYNMYKLSRVKENLYHRLATSLAYMGFDQFKDEYSGLWKCVLSGKSTIPIQPDGTLMSCGCLASVAAMATYTEAAVCPKCKVPFSKAQRVEKDTACKFSELSVAMDLATVKDEQIEATIKTMQAFLKNIPTVAEEDMQFQMMVMNFKGGIEEAKKVRAKARLLCTQERKYLTGRAAILGVHALKDIQGKFQQPPPIPRNTARETSQAAEARPAKRLRTDGDVNLIPSNERLDEPMPEGARLNSRSVKVGASWLMPTKFGRSKCPTCPSPMLANRTLVANMKGEDGRNNWVCAMCAVGMTSADAFEVAMGRKPQPPETKPVPSVASSSFSSSSAPPRQTKPSKPPISMADDFEI